MSPPVNSELKKHVLKLAAWLVVMDATVIGLYFAFHVPARPVKTQQTFVAVWVVLTLLVVATLMKPIRRARRGR